MILSDKAVKWMAVDVIICIICFILWVSSDDGGDVYEMLTMISGLALLVIPYVTMSKEEREKGREEGKRAEEREKQRKLENGYKCPNCGMKAGYPISKVSKSVSVGTMGLASNKIGKTYKCENCKYMW
ncbi:hypothetical protein NE645_09375 [Roseburia hominis]|nr:hypothetical protein [Roseburia hominis]